MLPRMALILLFSVLHAGIVRGGALDPRMFASSGQSLTGWYAGHTGLDQPYVWDSNGTYHYGQIIDGRAVFVFDYVEILDLPMEYLWGSRPLTILSKSDIRVGEVFLNGVNDRYFGTVAEPPAGARPIEDGLGGRGGASESPYEFAGADGAGGGSAWNSLLGGAGFAWNSIGVPASAGGGGAIEFGAIGAIEIGSISAVGGSGGPSNWSGQFGGGGGGGGGAVILNGYSVSVTGTISVRGGTGGIGANKNGDIGGGGSGGGGGGGEVVILAGEGGVDISGMIDVRGGPGGDIVSGTGHRGEDGPNGRLIVVSSGPITSGGTIEGPAILVPEPHSGLLVVVGLFALGGAYRRARSGRGN